MPSAAPTTIKKASLSRTLIAGALVAFFLSGAAGLIHEVTWARLFRHVMGNTTLAIATVLSVFMAGLALGSFIGGRIIDRRSDPLRVLAFLEGTIAVYCLLLPWLIDVSQPVYRLIYQNTHASFHVVSLVRFVFCAVLLLLPATFMGATLPVLSRFFARSSSTIGSSVGTLYAVNTFGAVLGASGAGFLLLPALGVSRTILVASLLNLAVCLVSYVLHRRAVAAWGIGLPPEESRGRPRPEGTRKREAPSGVVYGRVALVVLLIGYCLSGFAAISYEVVWTRVLSMIIGSSVYAFTMMLTAFILGLGIGSAIFSRLVDRVRDPMLVLAVIEVAIGVSALLVVPFLGELPVFVTAMISRFRDTFWQLQAAEFGVILLIMIVPTTLMGAAFPLVSRIFARGHETVGRSVGAVYGSNTIGAILGSFVGGFLLIPWLGTQQTIFVGVAANVLIGCAFLAVSASLVPARRALAAAVALVVAVVGVTSVPRWNPDEMTFGPYMLARRLSEREARSPHALRMLASDSKMLFHKEGLSATVTVKESPEGSLYLAINGKPDASTSSGDLPTEILLAQVPLLLHPGARSACVIGLASGITLGSAATHPLETLDCVEISSEVLEATRFFDEYNGSVLDDPRVRVLLTDGRNHLEFGSDEYDVIISEPSNPWIAGISDLFTKEFFEACRARLTPEGIACVWLETYNIDQESFRSVVGTFRSVFGHVTIWEPTDSNEFLLVGSAARLAVDHAALVRRMSRDAVAADVARIGIRTSADFLGHLVMGDEGTRRFSDGAPLHTDDGSRLEFLSPKLLTGNVGRPELLERINQLREFDRTLLAGPADDAELAAVRDEVSRIVQTKRHVVRARMLWRGGDSQSAIEEMRSAAALNPASTELRSIVIDVVQQTLAPGGGVSPDEATAALDELVREVPAFVEFRVLLAGLLVRQDRVDEAVEHYLRASELLPEDVDLQFNLAVALVKTGRRAEAVPHYRRAAALRPDYTEAYHQLGVILLSLGRLDEAADEFATAVRLEPDHARAHTQRGVALYRLGRGDESIASFREALRADPELAEAHNGLGAVLAERGEIDSAIASFREALRIRPDLASARANLNRLLGARGGPRR